MSSPIKPPGGTPSPPPSADGAGPTGRAGQKAPSETFQESLDKSAGTPAPKGVVEAGHVDGTQEVAADLRAGRIDAATAVERLVARTLEGPTAVGLTPAGRAELETFLRRMLAEDPALLALTKDLERGH